MGETSDDEDRNLFFKLANYWDAITCAQKRAIKWGQIRIRYLEQQAETIKSQLVDRNKYIDSLKDENDKLLGRLSGDPAVESDEDRQQRHRRERMLDEVTLICIRDEIGVVSGNLGRFGCKRRDRAAIICNGINQYYAEH